MQDQNHNKIKELILYIAERLALDPNFGAIKLNKILFYSDFYSYAETGESITGEEYFKIDFGPAPRCMLPVLRELKDAGAITTQKVLRFSKPQKRTVALRAANISIFTPEEISRVERVIENLGGKTAEQISEDSHFVGWHIAKDRETIPYETAFIGNPKEIIFTDKHIQKAKELTELHDLQ